MWSNSGTAIWHSYLLCHPDDIKSVLLDNNQNFRKGMIYEYLKPVCVGSEFVLMEAVLALATIAREYRLRPVPGQEIEPEALITLRPRGGLPMYIEPRGE